MKVHSTDRKPHVCFSLLILHLLGYRPILDAFKDMAIPHKACKTAHVTDIEVSKDLP